MFGALLLIPIDGTVPATAWPEHSEAWVKWAMIGLMTRRLAPAPGRNPGNDHFPDTLLALERPAMGRVRRVVTWL